MASREIQQQLAALGVEARGVSDDSRQIRPGDVFLAYPGDLADGRQYIADAIARGAVAVIWQAGGDFVWRDEWRVPQFPAENLRQLAGLLAHALCGRPSEVLSLIAITGTNGKTTVSQWIARAHPKRCGVIGTLGAGFPEAMQETGFTTPEATTLMRVLQDLRREEAGACALEASSIGIEEGRMNGARVDVAVFTNLTRDHLDYHGSMDAYAAAKARLFQWPRLRLAVVNLDDPFGRQLARETTAVKVLGYTIGDAHHDLPAVVRALDLVTTAYGQSFTLVAPNGRADIETPVLGRFNIANLLAVAAVLVDSGLPMREIARRLGELTPPPGRLERVGGKGEPLVAIDYAHTPDALENALATLREVADARGGMLWSVFGCGGDRDRGKRPLMGEVATRLADAVVLTSDNPRSEAPQTILDDIAAEAPRAVQEIDRAAAIRRAVLHAAPQDVILIAGKGHEPYQDIGGQKLPFSDLAEAEAALLARARAAQKRPGMQWSLAAIARAVDGELHGADISISGVSTDTRQVAAGQLFVALRGENFDAHDFLSDAVRAGATALLVRRDAPVPADVPAVRVDDTRLALGRLAAAWRRSFDLPVIAVTGSNGKTTTKEMIASILRAAFGEAVLATRGNLNNDIGLPLTLLGLDATHRAAVIEMGMNHPGEIAWLAGIGAPTVAVVTNAQRAHLAGMGSLAAVAEEKGAIYQGLRANGVAVINADDAFAERWRQMAGKRPQRSFALRTAATVRGVAHRRGLDLELTLSAPEGEVSVRLASPGEHNALNALAAASACLAADVPLATVAQGLAAFPGVKGRLQKRAGLHGAMVLDDTYNANPDSVRAGIDVLAATIGRKVLVLGDMGEIGEASAQMHDEIGGYARSQGIDRLLALGEASKVAVRNFGDGASHFGDVDKLLAALAGELDDNTTVLVKGSRFMKMERIADAIATDKEVALSPDPSPASGRGEADAATPGTKMGEH